MNPPQPGQPHKKRNLLAVAVLGAGLTCLVTANYRYGWRWSGPFAYFLPRPAHLTRPYGIAPEAFNAFVRACAHAGVSPDRITQTIGDFPLSKGYHHRDGTLLKHGVEYDYTAATDIHVMGLNDAQITRLLHELAQQGFACWYRHGGHWTGDEHIHAVYALLPMKSQLQRQVRLFLHERREAGLQPLKWERKLWYRIEESS